MATPPLILASGSTIRAQILANAGLDFVTARPKVDEAALKAAMRGRDLEEIALDLAEAKALSLERPGAFILGADQILEHRGHAYDKPSTMDEARKRILALQGEVHSLINGVVIARDGVVVYRRVDRPILHMRSMNESEIEAYLAAAGEDVLCSVGAYQVEALGARLFERIDGDYFAVLGLSILPVLGFLRSRNALPF